MEATRRRPLAAGRGLGDEPAAGGIPGVWSATGSFRYEPDMVAPQSPANGASVSAPIAWEELDEVTGGNIYSIRDADTLIELVAAEQLDVSFMGIDGAVLGGDGAGADIAATGHGLRLHSAGNGGGGDQSN